MLKWFLFMFVFIFSAVVTDHYLENSRNSKGSFDTLTGVTVKCEVVSKSKEM